MSDFDDLLSAQLDAVLGAGVVFSGTYHHGGSNPNFAGVVDSYPMKIAGVQPGDLRVRTRAAALPNVLTLKSPDTVVDGGSGAVFDVISASAEFGGVGVCLQLRKSATAGAGIAPPANSNSTGAAGQMAWDSSYLYVCVSTNSWKRAALSTW